VLYSFAGGNDAATPYSLLQDSDGNFRGVSNSGGNGACTASFPAPGCGALFEINAAGVESVTASFGAMFTGYLPIGRLLLGADGDLYGAVSAGGNGDCTPLPGCGAIFRMGTDGSGYSLPRVFADFASSATPQGGLIQGADGALYGTTQFGEGSGVANCPQGQGCGTVFRLAADGSVSYLHSFAGTNAAEGTNDGAYPSGSLLDGGDGNFYGTTRAGGSSGCNGTGCGTVFKVRADGSGYTLLYSFSGGADGSQPLDVRLIRGGDGKLYGTTAAGGGSGCGGGGCGTVYKLDTNGGGFTVLQAFSGGSGDGSAPRGLTLGSDGALYGTTFSGGASGDGIVFRLAQDGSTYTILHHFAGGATDGAEPNGVLLEARDGMLYGTTKAGGGTACSVGCGSIFALSKDGAHFQTIYGFSGLDDGAVPAFGLIQDANGTLYGVTRFGGALGAGTAFKLALSETSGGSSSGSSSGSGGSTGNPGAGGGGGAGAGLLLAWAGASAVRRVRRRTRS
jgi:uncharacterized repeat protein (TIGR03803 family)